MIINKEIIKQLEEFTFKDSSYIYICDKSNCHLSYNTQNIIQKKFNISNELKKILKITNEFLMINNMECKILKNDNLEIIKGIIVIKIDSNRFAIYINKNDYFDKKDLHEFKEFAFKINNYIYK